MVQQKAPKQNHFFKKKRKKKKKKKNLGKQLNSVTGRACCVALRGQGHYMGGAISSNWRSENHSNLRADNSSDYCSRLQGYRISKEAT